MKHPYLRRALTAGVLATTLAAPAVAAAAVPGTSARTMPSSFTGWLSYLVELVIGDTFGNPESGSNLGPESGSN